MPAPMPHSCPHKRKWALRNHRIKAGWPEDMLDLPPEPRFNREQLYHAAIDMIYEAPNLTSADIGAAHGVSGKTVRNALNSRHTNMTELRIEALEEVRF